MCLNDKKEEVVTSMRQKITVYCNSLLNEVAVSGVKIAKYSRNGCVCVSNDARLTDSKANDEERRSIKEHRISL